MAQDMYKTDTRIGGAWQAAEAVITIEGAGPMMALGFSLTYTRPVIPYRPINRSGKYLVGGRGSGTCNLSALIGPKASIREFLDRFADLCRVADNVITIKPTGVVDCEDAEATPITFVASGCVLVNMSLSLSQIGDLTVVTSGLDLMVNSVDYQ